MHPYICCQNINHDKSPMNESGSITFIFVRSIFKIILNYQKVDNITYFQQCQKK
jgi:hypothetical protein